MAMILELGTTPIELIRVTSEFSNAVLVAVMPYVADVAQKLDLAVPRPLTVQHVTECSITPTRNWGVELSVEGGWVFAFAQGYVRTIQSNHCYTMLQDPDEIPRFFGELRMSKGEAVVMARDALRKLNIPMDSVFAEQDPVVGGPQKVGNYVVPYYDVIWADPRGGASVEIEVNADAKRSERIQLRNTSLEKPLPRLNVPIIRDPASPAWPQVNPNYARQLLPFVLNAVESYTQKLGLPVPHPLGTNHVARFKLEEDRNSPRAEIELSNGWRFEYNHTQVDGFYAPDELFSSHSELKPIRLKDYSGTWNMHEAEAKQLVRDAIAKLHYPTNLVHFEVEAQVTKPAVPRIPRYMFTWNYTVNEGQFLQSSITAEVDAGKRELKSLYFYDASFLNPGPKIDVPLLLPVDSPPPSSPLAIPTGQSPPQRPIINAIPPRK
jgi:hypothetical protein